MVTAEKTLDNQRNGGYICATENTVHRCMQRRLRAEHSRGTMACGSCYDGAISLCCHQDALRL
jgi:hypothetical protein